MLEEQPLCQQLLYEVEDIVRMVEKKGQKYVLVKWVNFTKLTSEPVAYITEMELCDDELQGLQEDFEQKKYSNIIKIQHKKDQYFESYRNDMFAENDKIDARTKLPKNMKFEPSIQEKARCKAAALKQLIRRIQIGLNGLSADDYAHFNQLHYQCQRNAQKTIKKHRLPQTELFLNQIVGVIKNNDGFRFCVQVDQEIYTCSLEQMKNYFPDAVTEYLLQFTDHLERMIAQQIKVVQNLAKSRNYLQKLSTKITKMSKLKDIDQTNTNKNPAFFGKNETDAKDNRNEENERRRILMQICTQYSNGLFQNQMDLEQQNDRSNKDADESALEALYNQMMKQFAQWKKNKAKEAKKIKEPKLLTFSDESQSNQSSFYSESQPNANESNSQISQSRQSQVQQNAYQTPHRPISQQNIISISSQIYSFSNQSANFRQYYNNSILKRQQRKEKIESKFQLADRNQSSSKMGSSKRNSINQSQAAENSSNESQNYTEVTAKGSEYNSNGEWKIRKHKLIQKQQLRSKFRNNSSLFPIDFLASSSQSESSQGQSPMKRQKIQ